MLKHYLLLFYRNLKRNKNTFFINLIGLTTGLVAVLLIYLWVNDELHFDKFHSNDSHLYQVLSIHKNSTGIVTEKATSGLLVETLPNDMPEVETAACFVNYADNIPLVANNKSIRTIGKFGSKDFFKVFPFRLLEGNSFHVLTDRKSIIISEKLALALFETTENVIGKTIHIERFIS